MNKKVRPANLSVGEVAQRSGVNISTLHFYETKNLIHSVDRKIAIEIGKHRDILYRWILETNDKGRFPETDNALRAVVDRWGSKAVNREYERVREWPLFCKAEGILRQQLKRLENCV